MWWAVSAPSALISPWLSPTIPRIREQQGLRVHQRLPDLGDLPASVHRGRGADGAGMYHTEVGVSFASGVSLSGGAGRTSATGGARGIADRQYLPGHGAALTTLSAQQPEPAQRLPKP